MNNSRQQEGSFLWLTLVLDVGSNDELPGEDGYAHFTEHLAFRCYGDSGTGGAMEYLRRNGVSFNASTSRDWTVFDFFVRTADKDIIAKTIDIAADILNRKSYDHDAFDLERSVVLEEIRLGTRRDRIAKSFLSVIDPGGPRGHTVLGSFESISEARPAALEAFRARCYRPDAATLFVHGDEASLQAARLAFASIAARSEPRQALAPSGLARGAFGAEVLPGAARSEFRMAAELGLGTRPADWEAYRALYLRCFVLDLAERRLFVAAARRDDGWVNASFGLNP